MAPVGLALEGLNCPIGINAPGAGPGSVTCSATIEIPDVGNDEDDGNAIYSETAIPPIKIQSVRICWDPFYNNCLLTAIFKCLERRRFLARPAIGNALYT